MLRVAAFLLLLAAASGPALAGPRAEFLGASQASMDNPHDLKLTPDGQYLFVSDVGHDRVVKYRLSPE